jgi:nucleotide-binding universal stress UspA family protein
MGRDSTTKSNIIFQYNMSGIDHQSELCIWEHCSPVSLAVLWSSAYRFTTESAEEGSATMKVLLAVDDSRFSDLVVQAVANQLRCDDTEVLVLHVLQPVLAKAVPEMSKDYAPELEGEKNPANLLVQRIADTLRSTGFKAETAVEIGDPEVCILEAASAWTADLIVVGSHGKSSVRTFLLGSVSESVARHAKCSVEIVREPSVD